MARVRDRSQQAVLESLCWSIHRIWSRDWFRNPHEQPVRATATIGRARLATADPSSPPADKEQDEPAVPGASDEPAPEAAAATNPPAPAESDPADALSNKPIGRAPTVIEREEPEELAPAVETEPYEAAQPRVNLFGEDLHEAPPERVATVVTSEGPLHRGLLDAAGVGRMGRRIKRALQRGVKQAARGGKIVVEGDFLRHPEQEAPPIRDRSDADDYARKTEHLPPEEIATAATAIARQAIQYLQRRISRRDCPCAWLRPDGKQAQTRDRSFDRLPRSAGDTAGRR